jgi:hypothetical protein
MTVRHIFEINEDDHPPNTPTPLVNHARDHWWTLDFANAFVSPGVNSRAELVPSPQAYARKGALRCWLRDKFIRNLKCKGNMKCKQQPYLEVLKVNTE